MSFDNPDCGQTFVFERRHLYHVMQMHAHHVRFNVNPQPITSSNDGESVITNRISDWPSAEEIETIIGLSDRAANRQRLFYLGFFFLCNYGL